MKRVYLIEIFAVVFSIIAIFYFWFAISYLRKKSEERKKTQVILKVKPKSRKLYKLYKFFVDFKPTRKYVQKLQRMYEIRIPGDIRQTREKAARTALLIYAIVFVAILFLVFSKPSLLTWATIIYTTYVLCDQIIQFNVHRLDLQLISELSTFIDDVRHQYFVHGMVDESIEAALEKAPSLMKQHGQKILDIIQSDEDMLGELEKYCVVVPSYYLKMFADTCSKIMQYGDKIVDDQSLFLLSVQNLKEEIQMEQLRQNGLANKFKFLVGISVIPVYSINMLKGFGISGFTALRDLFNGSYGIWATIISFATSFATYKIVNRLRNSVHVDLQDKKGWKTLYGMKPVKKVVNNFLAKNWGRTLRLRDLLKKTGSSFNVRTFTTRCFLIFLATFVGFIAISVAAHWQQKKVAGSNVTAVASTTSGASDQECFMMLIIARQLLEDYKDVDGRKEYNVIHSDMKTMRFDDDVEKYYNEKLLGVIEEGMQIDEKLAYDQIDPFLHEHDSTTLAISSLQGIDYKTASRSDDSMIKSGFNTFKTMVSLVERDDLKLTDDERKALVKETVKQIKKYQNEYFHWYDLIMAFVCAVIGYNLPTWILKFERKALQMDMEDEVIQYKSSIMLLMHIDRMTTEVILESMLLIAVIFNQSIQKCINNLPLNENKAYDTLEEDEPFDAFKRLVENLRMVDKVGVKRAFSTVTSERKNYQEKRKQENEINVSERSAIAQFISMIPSYVVIFAYMVVPYIIEAISEFSHALADMKTYM